MWPFRTKQSGFTQSLLFSLCLGLKFKVSNTRLQPKTGNFMMKPIEPASSSSPIDRSFSIQFSSSTSASFFFRICSVVRGSTILLCFLCLFPFFGRSQCVSHQVNLKFRVFEKLKLSKSLNFTFLLLFLVDKKKRSFAPKTGR